uniref:Uncharacterized protein n=1 Tax=Ixodes ricinus TaxID=34613 RepID=A0A6B0V5H2_IXORI
MRLLLLLMRLLLLLMRLLLLLMRLLLLLMRLLLLLLLLLVMLLLLWVLLLQLRATRVAPAFTTLLPVQVGLRRFTGALLLLCGCRVPGGLSTPHGLGSLVPLGKTPGVPLGRGGQLGAATLLRLALWGSRQGRTPRRLLLVSKHQFGIVVNLSLGDSPAILRVVLEYLIKSLEVLLADDGGPLVGVVLGLVPHGSHPAVRVGVGRASSRGHARKICWVVSRKSTSISLYKGWPHPAIRGLCL